MTVSDVEVALGKPEFKRDSRSSFLSGFMVDFDNFGKVEFIELASSGEFSALYKGVNLHRVTAEETLSLIGRDDSFDPCDPELGYSYVFKNLQLSLWRGVVPESPDDEDGRYFEAIGVGRDNYYL